MKNILNKIRRFFNRNKTINLFAEKFLNEDIENEIISNLEENKIKIKNKKQLYKFLRNNCVVNLYSTVNNNKMTITYNDIELYNLN